MGGGYWLLLWILLGLSAGWLGHHYLGGTGYGALGDSLVAVVGALLGGAIYTGVAAQGRCPLAAASSAVGALVAVLVVRSVRSTEEHRGPGT